MKEKNFSDSLKSGVILCRLVNSILPNTIPRIHNSSMPFKQMENISAFLRASRYLGVAEFDVFETVDLFESKDMNSVVRCLLALYRAVQRNLVVVLDAGSSTSSSTSVIADSVALTGEGSIGRAVAKPGLTSNKSETETDGETDGSRTSPAPAPAASTSAPAAASTPAPPAASTPALATAPAAAAPAATTDAVDTGSRDITDASTVSASNISTSLSKVLAWLFLFCTFLSLYPFSSHTLSLNLNSAKISFFFLLASCLLSRVYLFSLVHFFSHFY